MSIKANLKEIRSNIPEYVTLVAVSKTKPNTDILEAYDAGQRIFGENKVQEMVQKWETLPKDIEWHMIGHLQRNKVKYMANFVSLIHGVDSLRLLQEINKQAIKHNRVIDCLFQIHIAEEDTKFGLDQKEIEEITASGQLKKLENVRIVGLMGMATFTDNQSQVRKEFENLKAIFNNLKNTLPSISILSMGMSGDYQLAIKEGSTMIRVGSSIFGSRNYH
ncbi:YggS family pyridoxal phosphate-dependent enzyme [Kriegella sp. EG-1]|nr:YggS family pyridoxal phosphate-dependent enzyme [Flavobacteriaceae bacterium EG-1]